MATARSLKVSRVKLIEALKTKAAEREAEQAEAFTQQLAECINVSERAIKAHQEGLAKLKKVKTSDDLVALSRDWYYKCERNNNDLNRQIRMLELSDEEYITIGPTSELAVYL